MGAEQVDMFMRALSSHEGTTTSVNPDTGAQGAFQILPANWPSWARQAGVDPNDRSQANQNAVARAKMLEYYNQFGNWRDVAVAWYGGPGAVAYSDGAKNAAQGGGKYPSINKYADNVMSTFNNGGKVMAASAGGGAPAEPGAKTRLPSDATVYVVDGGTTFAVFDVGGVKLRFDVNPSTVDLTGANIKHISGGDFGSMGTVNAGDAAGELGSVTRDYGTFDSFYNSLLTRLLPKGSASVMDAGVRGVIAQVAANPGLLTAPTEIQRLLGQTDWYQGLSDKGAKYNQSSDAEKKTMVGDAFVTLARDFEAQTGQQVAWGDARIMSWAQEMAEGKRGEGAILYQEIIPIAMQNPESPHSRDARAEQEKQLDRGNTIETKAAEVSATFAKWGIPITPGLANQWGSDLTTGQKSDGDLQTYLQDQSKVLYPWKDPTVPTMDAATPWLSKYETVLENKPTNGLQDPLIQKALNNGTPLWEFEQQLKQDPRWLQTDNARNDMTSAMFGAGKLMGFE